MHSRTERALLGEADVRRNILKQQRCDEARALARTFRGSVQHRPFLAAFARECRQQNEEERAAVKAAAAGHRAVADVASALKRRQACVGAECGSRLRAGLRLLRGGGDDDDQHVFSVVHAAELYGAHYKYQEKLESALAETNQRLDDIWSAYGNDDNDVDEAPVSSIQHETEKTKLDPKIHKTRDILVKSEPRIQPAKSAKKAAEAAAAAAKAAKEVAAREAAAKKAAEAAAAKKAAEAASARKAAEATRQKRLVREAAEAAAKKAAARKAAEAAAKKAAEAAAREAAARKAAEAAAREAAAPAAAAPAGMLGTLGKFAKNAWRVATGAPEGDVVRTVKMEATGDIIKAHYADIDAAAMKLKGDVQYYYNLYAPNTLQRVFREATPTQRLTTKFKRRSADLKDYIDLGGDFQVPLRIVTGGAPDKPAMLEMVIVIITNLLLVSAQLVLLGTTVDKEPLKNGMEHWKHRLVKIYERLRVAKKSDDIDNVLGAEIYSLNALHIADELEGAKKHLDAISEAAKPLTGINQPLKVTAERIVASATDTKIALTGRGEDEEPFRYGSAPSLRSV